MKKKNGFTLVELLAVIVILAIILVIAVPQVLSSIESARLGSIESSVKMIAKTGKTLKQAAEATGDTLSTDCMEWGGINDTDYQTCTYDLESGEVTLTPAASGKFSKWPSCAGDEISVTCTPKA